MTERHAKYQLAQLGKLHDAYFGGVSHGSGNCERGTDQGPGVVRVRVNEKGHPQYAFLEGVESLKQEMLLELVWRKRLVAGPITDADAPAANSVSGRIYVSI